MSDETPPLTLDDRAILQALRTLEVTTQEDLLGRLREGEESSVDLVRQYTEILGQLPWALEPVEPRSEVFGRIRAAIFGDETQRFSVEDLRPVAPPEAPPSVEPVQVPTMVAARAGSSGWMRLLAAGLALAVLGLGAAVHSLRNQLADETARVDRLVAELDAERRVVQPAISGPELTELRSRIAMVTDVGTSVCALRTPGATGVEARARGLLFVAADHQHWYLKAGGLPPVAPGMTYQLWFLVEEDRVPVSAGTFNAAPGHEVELGSPEMPHDTRAVAVTVEPEGGVESPTGPMILFGDEVMELI